MNTLFAFLAFFAGLGVIASLGGLVFNYFRGKPKKPFALGFIANMIAMIVFGVAFSNTQDKVPTQPKQAVSTQQTQQNNKLDKYKDDDHDDDKDDKDHHDYKDKDDRNYDDDKYDKQRMTEQAKMGKNQHRADVGPNGETIKGNINSKGEKIYHMPGSKYYDKTVPEQWFFTERDAINAGYRPAKR